MTPNGNAPVRKVSAGGIAASLSIVLVFVLGSLGVDVPPEVASAITAIIGFVAAYLTPANAGE